MRYGIVILAFSVVLAGEGQNRAPSGNRPGYTDITPDRPVKCGWGTHAHPLQARIASLFTRPVRQVTYLSPDGAFAVHYDTTAAGPNGMDHSPDLTDGDPKNGTPDWVEAVAAALSHARNLLLTLDFEPAPDDSDGVYDVYLAGNLRILYNLSGETYGLTNPETDLGGNRWTSFMEMDNDFSVTERFYTKGLAAAQVTAAHEYFHAVQMGYVLQFPGGSVKDAYLYELSSTWFEEVAFPEVGDWLYWYDQFNRNPTVNIAQTDGYSIAIFGHYLTWWFGGKDIMRQVWNAFKSVSAVDALENGLAARSGNLTSAWTDFVARLFGNGQASNPYFHIDQDFLEPPDPGPVVTLIDSLTVLPFYNLYTGTARIQALQPTRPINLRLQVQPVSTTYAARVVLDNDTFSLHNITTIFPLYLSGVSSISKVVLVVGGEERDSVVLAATAMDTMTSLAFSLDYLAPNPFIIGKPAHSTITLGYTVGKAMKAGDPDVVIYNLLGQQIYRFRYARTIGEGSHTLKLVPLPISTWSAGVYILRLTLDQRHTFTRKFTILR